MWREANERAEHAGAWQSALAYVSRDTHSLTFGFARCYAFKPRVSKIIVAWISTLLEPRTTTTAAAGLTGLPGAAFGTHGVHRAGSRRDGVFRRQ